MFGVEPKKMRAQHGDTTKMYCPCHRKTGTSGLSEEDRIGSKEAAGKNSRIVDHEEYTRRSHPKYFFLRSHPPNPVVPLRKR